MVPLLARSGLGPASRSGWRPPAKDATTTITRRRHTSFTASAWAGLLWGLALLGLLLLPSDYRAGAETAHGHALMHLWLDAADGAIRHHHDPEVHDVALDWLEPVGARADGAGAYPGEGSLPDVGGHQDSAQVGAGVHLLIAAVVVLVFAAARATPPSTPRFSRQGRAVPVLLPPPRWLPLTG